MSKSSEEVLLIVANVKNKKCEGSLYMMGERMAWMQPSKTSFTLSYNYADIKSQKISPETKEKVQLQILLHDGGANTFQFTNTKGRDVQKVDREGIKELLQQLLPKFRRKISSELEEKNRLLQSDPVMFQLYKDLVVSGVISADEFWANRADNTKVKATTNQEVGISAAFLADIKPQTDGCNGFKYNLTPDIIQSIFRTYPAVQQKHMECVPDKLPESEFWTKFFQSHYFHRDRISFTNKDLFAECAKTDDEEMKEEKLSKVNDPLLDIAGLSDSTVGDGYGNASDVALPTSSAGAVNQSLIKRFNQHSLRVLQTCDKYKFQSTAAADVNGSSLPATPRPATPATPSSDPFQSRSTTPLSINGPSGSGRNSASSQFDEDPPPIKKARIREKNKYVDLEGDKNKHSGPTLKLTHMDRYLHGPTPVTAISYHTSEDIIHACQAVHQDMMAWKPKLTHVLHPAVAVSALGELTPGGALMQRHTPQQLHRLVSDELQQELKQLYSALCELLRHYWMCFPVTSKALEEKVVRMRGNLERFQMAKLNPFKQKLHEGHYAINLTGHLEELLESAFNKFNLWQTKRMGKRT